MDFGFTNSLDRYRAAVVYRESAVLDGWTFDAMYDTEDITRASVLTRDGFTMQILTREVEFSRQRFQVSIHIWAPDRLTVVPPNVYSMAAIRASAKNCNYCGTIDVPTQRVGFAGRCCVVCLPDVRKRAEPRGWTH